MSTPLSVCYIYRSICRRRFLLHDLHITLCAGERHLDIMDHNPAPVCIPFCFGDGNISQSQEPPHLTTVHQTTTVAMATPQMVTITTWIPVVLSNGQSTSTPFIYGKFPAL